MNTMDLFVGILIGALCGMFWAGAYHDVKLYDGSVLCRDARTDDGRTRLCFKLYEVKK